MRRFIIFLITGFYAAAFQARQPLSAQNLHWNVHSDKARYTPGDTVHFQFNPPSGFTQGKLHIGYYHLSARVGQDSLHIETSDAVNWNWLPPDDDFKGYQCLLILTDGMGYQDSATIAVDVSSNWKRFPRYGFLSKFDYLGQDAVDQIIRRLNRYHINGLQFYDWHYKHHLPLKGTVENPAYTWPDIANRTIYLATVKRYLQAARDRKMKTMAYNLLYGAYEDASKEGVSELWRLFSDQNHQYPDYHDLPDSWASDIYLIDPSNGTWQNYIASKMGDVFEALDFDGWHVDQLGNRGNRYNYNGDQVILKETFAPFLNFIKQQLDIPLVMNAVNQYGQSQIAGSAVDFLYTEVWDPYDSFSDLAGIITRNNDYASDTLATVLAAYVNKGLSASQGPFNTPAVLLADAVIFAAGGAHLELGEHMLCSEYFPHDNLYMDAVLQMDLLHYYDFSVAYQNLLRDGGEFVSPDLTTPADSVELSSLAKSGSVWMFSRRIENRRIYHLINLRDVTTMQWRDNNGIQSEPRPLKQIELNVPVNQNVKRVWMASPDYRQGLARELSFGKLDGQIRIILPYLKYWSMLVVETADGTNIEHIAGRSGIAEDYLLPAYPNPFNSETTIRFSMGRKQGIKLFIYDNLGRVIRKISRSDLPAGMHRINWYPQGKLPSGIYHYHIQFQQGAGLYGKLIYIK